MRVLSLSRDETYYRDGSEVQVVSPVLVNVNHIIMIYEGYDKRAALRLTGDLIVLVTESYVQVFEMLNRMED